ncbi:MAG: hypothetical protein J5607_11330 [Clostridiales bacterium]|nr:hypothetical protein [Clostridiales bacterium]
MKNTILRKRKTVSSLVLAATVAFSMFGTGCNKKADQDNTETSEITSSGSESTSQPDETESTTESTPETTESIEETEPTSESTRAPYQSLDDILIRGDKDYYIPFQDPDHSYSSVAQGWAAPVRQQGSGGCYAYSAVTAMQIKYLQDHGKLIDINPVDVINRIFENADDETVYDEEKIYVESVEPTNLGGSVMDVVSVMCAEPLNGYVVTDASAFAELSNEEIKELIKEYGGLSFSVDYQRDCKVIHGYETQNYSGTNTDHVATIVGWDDDFPADCFKTPASQNGAWLVQNSFGINWGNCGYYFVSYDQNIRAFFSMEASNEYSSGISYGRFTKAQLPTAKGLSQLDETMDISRFSVEEMIAWGDMTTASIYEQEGSVAAIGSWCLFEGQPYTIEIRDGEFGDVLATKSGTFERRGYHTVKLDTPVAVSKFTVVVKMAGVGAFEGPSYDTMASTAYANNYPAHYEAKIEPGRSFVEIDGEWIDVTDKDLLKKMGLDSAIKDEQFTTVGDPCITVLFE